MLQSCFSVHKIPKFQQNYDSAERHNRSLCKRYRWLLYHVLYLLLWLCTIRLFNFRNPGLVTFSDSSLTSTALLIRTMNNHNYWIYFFNQVADYSNLYGSVFALLRVILGDFDYYALEKADRTLGPIFFFTYVFFVFFILLVSSKTALFKHKMFESNFLSLAITR